MDILNYAEALKVANVILGLVIFYLGFDYFRKNGKSWKYIKFLYGFVGLYWACAYLFMLLVPLVHWNTAWFGLHFIRGGITGTLIVIASGALYRRRYGG